MPGKASLCGLSDLKGCRVGVSTHTDRCTHSWGTGAAGPDEEEIERCGKLPDPTERHNGSARPGGVPQGPRRGVSSSGQEGQKRLLTHCAHESRWKDSLPVAVVFVCVCWLLPPPLLQGARVSDLISPDLSRRTYSSVWLRLMCLWR